MNPGEERSAATGRTFTVLQPVRYEDNKYEIVFRSEPAGDHALAAQLAGEGDEGPVPGTYIVIEQTEWREFAVGANVVAQEVTDDD